MRPSFYPRLVNGPFDDPALFIPFLLRKQAILFDLGDIHALSARDILKVSHVFVTHTHIDHFIGFDRILRLLLGRAQPLSLFGPAGFFDNVAGKLAGYAWNLVHHYSEKFVLKVTEVHPQRTLTRTYPCQNRFRPVDDPVESPWDGTLHQDSTFAVTARILDHRLPCLGLSIQERFHVNIIKAQLIKLGLEIGPWLNRFKQALFDNCDPESLFEVECAPGRQFDLGELARQIATITPGQKICYIADAAYTPANVEKIVSLAQGADHLFIEAAFLEEDHTTAALKSHLTARQAGSIAGKARVKHFTVFHFSPRYIGKQHLLEDEARAAFEQETGRQGP